LKIENDLVRRGRSRLFEEGRSAELGGHFEEGIACAPFAVVEFELNRTDVREDVREVIQAAKADFLERFGPIGPEDEFVLGAAGLLTLHFVKHAGDRHVRSANGNREYGWRAVKQRNGKRAVCLKNDAYFTGSFSRE
jgi:hypothetical protein